MGSKTLLFSLLGLLVGMPALGAGQSRGRHVVKPRTVHSMPRPLVMDLATRAYGCAKRRSEIHRPVLTVIDYSLPSIEPRLWVIDMRNQRVILNELVAHGRNSGHYFASRFSNVPGSLQSSLGLFRAEEAYRGKHGYSLRMAGLEAGVNDNARDRAIVLHGADYVSRSFISQHGRLGRSWGCPAVRSEVSREVIDLVKDGGAVFAYYPDEDWLSHSEYLRCGPEPL